MTFQNYKTADYAQSTLAGSISSGATSLQVDTWDGALFPSTWDFFITLEAFTLNAQETETITKREQIKVTARTSDTMTIVRWVNDTTAQAFDAGDRVSLYLVAENLDDINTEIARLETDKLDNDELRTWLGASKILTTNGSGSETELAFSGDATQTLLGDGTRGASQTDINGQTLENWTLASSDEIIFYDASAWVNRKRNATATTTREWLVELSTDSEVLSAAAGKVATTNQLAQFWLVPVSWTDYLLVESTWQVTTTSATDVKLREFEVDYGGTYRYSVDVNATTWTVTYPSIYVNGVFRTWGTRYTSSTTASWSVTVVSWDLVQLYLKTDFTAEAEADDFKLTYDIWFKFADNFTATVNL